jgi:acetyltransferase
LLSLNEIAFFLNPRSVALVGVTTRTEPEAYNPLDPLLKTGFSGRIYAVNPKGGEVLGQTLYHSILELPEVVDLAVISTPREAVLKVVKECVAKEIKAIIVITQGFADGDKEGQMMQAEMNKIIQGTRTRLIGPNTIGVINAFTDFHTVFVDFHRQINHNCMISQSGIFLVGSADFTAGIGLGIDLGNAADVEVSDLLEYLGNNAQIKVINLHIEGIKNGRRFMELARKVGRKKPIFCLKTGRSEVGAKAVMSHSGSLAGEDHVFEAAFKQSGIIRVQDVEEMRSFNKTFLTYQSISGPRIAVLTISGGAGIATADAMSKYNLKLAQFSPSTVSRLKKVFPDWMEVINPADIWPAGMMHGYRHIYSLSLEIVLSDHQVDAVFCVTPAYLHPAQDKLLNISDLLNQAAAKHPEKPVAVWVYGPYRQEFASILEKPGRIVAYHSPERAMAALGALYHYHHRIKPALETTEEKEPLIAFNDQKITRVKNFFYTNRKQNNAMINFPELGELLQAYGIPTVSTKEAYNLAEALAAAEEIGYPVVMKVLSSEVTHKSDVGGVYLNLNSPALVEKAFKKMKTLELNQELKIQVLGVLIQPYVTNTDSIEVILGSKKDPVFGPVLVYGLGGIYTELFKDIAFRIAPINRTQALAMIQETRSYQLLLGFRGKPPLDLEALVNSLLNLGQMVVNHPEIQELDLNPLLVMPKGVLALDARLRLD